MQGRESDIKETGFVHSNQLWLEFQHDYYCYYYHYYYNYYINHGSPTVHLQALNVLSGAIFSIERIISKRVKGWTLESLEREVFKDKESTISFLQSRGVL